MELPTSTIVMAVLTCIPFGLAIRDTVNGTPGVTRGEHAVAADPESYEEEDFARDNARREAEEAEEAAKERLEAAKQEQLRAQRHTLYGAEVATLGSGFAGISLGMPERDIRSETITALERATRVDVDLLSNDTLDWILIKPERDADEDASSELCAKLGSDLADAWGRGQTNDPESRYWVNATTRTRASLSSNSDGCRLSFERFAEAKGWINKTKMSLVPIWLVGQPIEKLRAYVGSRGDLDPSEPSVRWLGLGVGYGSGEARFEAHIVKGKIVAITATTETLEATHDEVVAQLSTLYGAAIEDDEGVHWKSRPAISVDDFEGAGVRVTVGTLPDAE